MLDGDDFTGRNLNGLIDNAKTSAYCKVSQLLILSAGNIEKIGLTSKLLENLVLVGHYDLQGIWTIIDVQNGQFEAR